MNIQAIEINSTEDIILIEFNEDSSYNDISTILDCIKKTFPQNKVLAIKENIIKDLIIFKQSNTSSNDLTDWLKNKIKDVK